MEILRPTWLEINIDQFVNNLKIIKNELSNNTELLFVVKNNAYGTGLVPMAYIAAKNGIQSFATATLEEALLIRDAIPNSNILVFGYNTDKGIKKAIEKDITVILWDYKMAMRYNQLAVEVGKPLMAFIAWDTGMHRLGFNYNEDTIEDILKINQMEYIEILGNMSHFSRTESGDESFTKKQLNKFNKILKRLDKVGISKGICHLSDSVGIIKHREADFDLVRCGALAYGALTGGDYNYKDIFRVKPIATLKARVAQVRHIEAGDTIGYGTSYIAENSMDVATLPIGYGDGLLFGLENKIDVLIQGRRCPQIGHFCMDMMFVDVTDIDCDEGDAVVIIGKYADEEITFKEWADILSVTPTYPLSNLRERIPRVYMQKDKIIHIEYGR